jgi:hypothetical protein
MLYDHGEIVELRLPADERSHAVRGSDDLRGIACTAIHELDLKVGARHLLDRNDHLQHGEAPAVAAVHRGGSAADAQVC